MTRDEILDSVNITDLVRQYGIKIDRKGFCCCPFHNEKTASMKIYPKSNSYYCFGCGASGDIFRFVQDIDNCDFKTAFISLGGTYEEQSKEARMAANAKREREKKRREMAEQVKAKLRKELAYILEVLKAGCRLAEPYSEWWCLCHNKIPILFNAWDCIERGEEINEVDVYRICGEVRRYIDNVRRSI